MMLPFSWIYGAVTGVWTALYERGVFRRHSLGTRVISIGNITAGGTGKTPLAAFAAEILAESGERVGILTRGYGRRDPKRRVLVSDGQKILADARQAGDEPFELAGKLLGKALVIADADRVAAGVWAREEFGVSAFVLDDAFQHRRVKRDLDIVAIDATDPFGNGKLLPAGILREPPENLRRADLIIITRANLSDRVEQLKMRIAEYNPHCPIFVSENKVAGLTLLEEFHAGVANYELRITNYELIKAEIRNRRSLAFCGLGNPDNFFEQLKCENFQLVAAEKFPDHHVYTPKDIERLNRKAAETGAEIMLTTVKDAVKLKDLRFDLPCYVVENRLIFDDEKKLHEIIRTVFNPKPKI